jgi:hypothetical protein
MDETQLGLVGGATGGALWFADKVLGPSAEALGENLKAYLAERWRSIALRAGEIAAASDVHPQPIRPGLLTRMIMDASFSDEDSTITEWWANLFVDASQKSSNKHAVFADMMALFGPAEASCLDEFVDAFSFADEWFFSKLIANDIIEVTFEEAVNHAARKEALEDKSPSPLGGFPLDGATWPMIATEWLMPSKDETARLMAGHNEWYFRNSIAVGILERSAVLKPVRVVQSVFGGTIWVKGLVLSALGFEFYGACRGYRRHDA